MAIFIMYISKEYMTFLLERKAENYQLVQRQRIILASGILKDAHILILDEATSNMDQLTVQNIQNHLWEFMKIKTNIIITHRLLTLLFMGRILVLHRKKSQKMILIQRFISWHIRWQSSYSELDFSKQVSKFKNILQYFNFCLDRSTNPDYAFINLKSKSYVRDFYTLQWKKVENIPSNKPSFLKLRKLSLKFKQINPQIYLQQHSMMKLVQNQKLQCNF